MVKCHYEYVKNNIGMKEKFQVLISNILWITTKYTSYCFKSQKPMTDAKIKKHISL